MATQVLESSTDLTIKGERVHIEYARESFKGNHLHARESLNPIAQAAMAQAQWSMANKYHHQSSTTVVPQKNDLDPPSLAKQTPRKQWPLPFEQGGASYVYDASTGFYLEKQSSFYYDTQTKLYYSSFMKKYFRYDSESKDGFVVFDPPLPEDTDADSAAADATKNHTSSTTHVATTTVGKTKKSKKQIQLKLVPKLSMTKSKQKIADEINKWTQIQKTDDVPESSSEKSVAPSKVQLDDVDKVKVPPSVGSTLVHLTKPTTKAAGKVVQSTTSVNCLVRVLFSY